jgi:hypothetical protein
VVEGAVGDGFTVKLRVTMLADAGAFIQPFTIGIESMILYVYVPAAKLVGGV